jgi:hypothetical protein
VKILVILALGYLAWDNLSWFLDTLEEPPEADQARMTYDQHIDAYDSKWAAFLRVAVSFGGLLAAMFSV